MIPCPKNVLARYQQTCSHVELIDIVSPRKITWLASSEDSQTVGADGTHPFIAGLANQRQQNRTSGPPKVFPA